MHPQLITYQVQLRVLKSIQKDYQAWLVDHVVGNSQKGIPGMLELTNAEGDPLFIKAEVHLSDSPLHPDHCLYRANYFLEDIAMMEYYEQKYAAMMRSQFPAEFAGKVMINRCLYLPEIVGDWDTELGAEQAAIEKWEVVI